MPNLMLAIVIGISGILSAHAPLPALADHLDRPTFNLRAFNAGGAGEQMAMQSEETGNAELPSWLDSTVPPTGEANHNYHEPIRLVFTSADEAADFNANGIITVQELRGMRLVPIQQTVNGNTITLRPHYGTRSNLGFGAKVTYVVRIEKPGASPYAFRFRTGRCRAIESDRVVVKSAAALRTALDDWSRDHPVDANRQPDTGQCNRWRNICLEAGSSADAWEIAEESIQVPSCVQLIGDGDDMALHIRNTDGEGNVHGFENATNAENPQQGNAFIILRSITIRGTCYADDCEPGPFNEEGNRENGVNFGHVYDSAIIDVRIDHVQTRGVQLGRKAGSADRNIVVNSQVYGARHAGILLNAGDHNWIQHNLIDGLHADKTAFKGNLQLGISVETPKLTGANNARWNYFVGNRIRSLGNEEERIDGYGIKIQVRSGSQEVHSNKIINNVIHGIVGSRGIRANYAQSGSSAADLLIDGNKLVGGVIRIIPVDAPQCAIDDVQISNNDVELGRIHFQSRQDCATVAVTNSSVTDNIFWAEQGPSHESCALSNPPVSFSRGTSRHGIAIERNSVFTSCPAYCPVGGSGDVQSGFGRCVEVGALDPDQDSHFLVDNCPFDTNEDQADADGDEVGDACDP